MDGIKYDAENGESFYEQVTDQAERPAQMALAILNNTIIGTAHLRADAAYMCGKGRDYSPTWPHEFQVLSKKLDSIGIDLEKGLTGKMKRKYREAFRERYQVVLADKHQSLVLEDPFLDIPDRARPPAA